MNVYFVQVGALLNHNSREGQGKIQDDFLPPLCRPRDISFMLVVSKPIGTGLPEEPIRLSIPAVPCLSPKRVMSHSRQSLATFHCQTELRATVISTINRQPTSLETMKLLTSLSFAALLASATAAPWTPGNYCGWTLCWGRC
jgi:hypothetical protein